MSLLAALPWALPFVAIAPLARRKPDVADQVPDAETPVSVIIPARNESGNIEGVVRSLLASVHAQFEVIVVDDRSSDDTAARVAAMAAQDPRLRLVPGAELPEGWLGKPWACR